MMGGRIALITGAGSGIGQCISKKLAKEGARVAVADINEKAAQETVNLLPNPNEHFAIEVDVSKLSSVVNAFDATSKYFGQPPTLLAQAAGITRDNFLNKLEEKQFDDVINVNLKGTYFVQQQFCKQLEAYEDLMKVSSVVNFSSVVAKNGNMGQSNYAASKAAVEAFTKSTAKELGKKGIRINCIRPGFVLTPMVKTVPDHLKNMIVMFTPLQRMGEPEEIAEVVTFLLSEKSSFMTGSILDVTGGLSL